MKRNKSYIRTARNERRKLYKIANSISANINKINLKLHKFNRGVLNTKDGFVNLIEILKINKGILGSKDELESLRYRISEFDNKHEVLISMEQKEVAEIARNTEDFLNKFETGQNIRSMFNENEWNNGQTTDDINSDNNDDDPPRGPGPSGSGSSGSSPSTNDSGSGPSNPGPSGSKESNRPSSNANNNVVVDSPMETEQITQEMVQPLNIDSKIIEKMNSLLTSFRNVTQAPVVNTENPQQLLEQFDQITNYMRNRKITSTNIQQLENDRKKIEIYLLRSLEDAEIERANINNRL